MMGVAIEVPFNTVLADMDAALRKMLGDALDDHGFNGVEIAFEAPDREWAAGISKPTLNLFMYDLREAKDAPAGEWVEHRGGNAARVERPPMRIDCAYSITAWTSRVQDEHRMLSQTLAVLLAFERLPATAMQNGLSAHEEPISTRIGRPKVEGASEFWTALGGKYKLSLDYVVTLSVDPGITFHRGPEVRTQTVRVFDRERPPGKTTELHRTGGEVRDGDGRPVEGAWLVLPDAGGFAVSGPDGRFTFPRVPPGRHRCECRAPNGATASGEIEVSGAPLTLTVERSA
jgi:Pvc16 N-terminal domain/Carboxypeptidase regulatory-like domain